MKVILIEDAIQDLQEIYEFIAQDSAVAADRHREKLIQRGACVAVERSRGTANLILKIKIGMVEHL